ncbi:hypothetical protein [Streptomyces sp. NPDC054794]
MRKYRPSGESIFSPEALTLLQRCPWPENVRQLESVIRGAARRPSGRRAQAEDLPPECRVSSHKALTTIEAPERGAILPGLIDRNSNVQRTAHDLESPAPRRTARCAAAESSRRAWSDGPVRARADMTCGTARCRRDGAHRMEMDESPGP